MSFHVNVQSIQVHPWIVLTNTEYSEMDLCKNQHTEPPIVVKLPQDIILAAHLWPTGSRWRHSGWAEVGSPAGRNRSSSPPSCHPLPGRTLPGLETPVWHQPGPQCGRAAAGGVWWCGQYQRHSPGQTHCQSSPVPPARIWGMSVKAVYKNCTNVTMMLDVILQKNQSAMQYIFYNIQTFSLCLSGKYNKIPKCQSPDIIITSFTLASIGTNCNRTD